MRVTHVAAIRKLADIFPKMLFGDVNVRAANRTLQLRPMAFDAVRVMDTVNPFVFVMVADFSSSPSGERGRP